MSTLAPREKLEIALAVNRGIEYLDKLKFSTISHTGAQKGLELGQLFFDIHKSLYQDSHGSSSGADGSDRVISHASSQIKEEINALAGEMFDNNGNFKPRSELSQGLAETLATAFKNISNISPQPFSYGNELSTRLFFVSVGRMPGFKEYYGSEIDFRGLDKADVQALKNKDSSLQALTTVFEHATDPARKPTLGSVEPFKTWPDERTVIGGLNFLKHEKYGKEYLVTANGGLIERGKVEGALLEHLGKRESLVGDFKVQPQDIKYYLVPELKDKKIIDGVDLGKGVPLICMDTQSVTGLSTKNHNRLLDYLHKQGLEGDVLFQLADTSTSSRIIGSARDSGNTEMLHILEVSSEKIHNLRDMIEAEKDKLFAGKTPIPHGEHAKLFISMGGSATGKSSVKELAKRETGNNYVMASLDDARTVFDTYKVMSAVGHHADDYVGVEDMAKTLREWITKKALGENFNILYDGSGINYKPRYSELAATAKKQGYSVQVGAADCLLSVPQHRRDEFPEGAVDRAMQRFDEEKRALPWNVTIGKHIGFLNSLMDAFGDKSVDKVTLDDRAGKKGFAYNMGESFEVDIPTLTRLQQAKKSGHLLDELRATSMMPTNTPEQQKNLPEPSEGNVDFLHKMVAGKHRVFVFNNVQRAIDLAQKAHLNPHAQGVGNLTHQHGNLAFHVPDIDTPNGDGVESKPGHLRLHNPSEPYKDDYAGRYKRDSTPKPPSR